MLSRLFSLFLLSPSIALAFTLTTSNMKGWNKDEVKFRFNPANCGSDTGRVESAIREGVDLWNSVPTSRLRVTYAGQTSATGMTDEPIVSCVTSGMDGSVGVAGIITQGGVILTSDIQMNKESGASGDIASISDTRLAVALAHEMGHVFGIGHSLASTSLMYFSLGSKQNLSLSQDDIDGITYLYPRSEPGDGVMGCGSLEAGGGPGGLLFVLALAGLLGFASRSRRPFRSRPALA